MGAINILKKYPSSESASILGLINRHSKHHEMKKAQINPIKDYEKEIAERIKASGRDYVDHNGLRYRLPKTDCVMIDAVSLARDHPEIFEKYAIPVRQELIIEKIK